PIDVAQPMNPEAQAADMLAVLDAVGSERVAVVAEAGLGAAAVVLAATHPDRVQALVLVNSSARFLADDDYPIGMSQEFVASFVNDLTDPDEDWKVDEADDLALMVPTLANDLHFREWWVRASRRSASPASARALMAAEVYADVRSLLPDVTVPTLVVHAAANEFVPMEMSWYLAEHIPGAKFLTVDSADSSMWGLDADLYVDVIEEFLTGKRT